MKADGEILMVDGYNVIGSWPELANLGVEDLAHARDKLLHSLVDYAAFTGRDVVVVFDAHRVKGGVQVMEEHHSVQVIYTAEGETADGVIERLTANLGASRQVVVATSDWTEQRVVMGKGAVRLSARELVEELKATQALRTLASGRSA